MDVGSKTEPARAEEVYTTPRKGGVMNKLYPPGPKPGAGGRVKNHCRKFWWCDCLILIALVLVIVLPLIFIGLPKKAQHEINDSTLEVTNMEVTDPSPDSVHLKIENVIRSDSSYHPRIETFRAGLSLEGQEPFIYINIPEAKSESETFITVEQDVTFNSADAFAAYTKAVLSSEELTIDLNGDTTIHTPNLPATDVHYNKKITMKGLNHLSGLNISDIKILSGKSEILSDGSNMLGTVHIPNPSVMTLDLGNVTMNLGVSGKGIGYALLPDLVLKPGANNVPMQARVDQPTLISMILSTYKNGVLPLEIVGNSSVKGDAHLSYYEEAIKANTIKLDLDAGPALRAIGINVTDHS
ncbi:uncharacterized protein EKO05_0002115 [Ascochyta rabiei]|uniref:uncharacterized protein n=1 Tax=Didymella rabiei TaxID=5454 RepID=UPI0019020F21|nr:uncharacterized protein EKO05_0002115 [Ascochyta rabiei]UPX11510.1 hypothetical protein EKO05_0002115 [Ascochyta rabiei]